MTSDEGNKVEVAAAVLICTRDAEGHLEPISAAAAKNLLASVRAVPASMGAYTLQVPVDAVVRATLAGTWNRAEFPRVTVRGRSHYEIDSVLGAAMLAKLEAIAGSTLSEAQALLSEGRGH